VHFKRSRRTTVSATIDPVLDRESLASLTKESFFCLRYPFLDDTCIVECKRRDKKPLGAGTRFPAQDLCIRRVFAFTQSRQASYGPLLVHVREIPFSAGKIGGSIWKASIAMGQYIALHPHLVKNKRVLELGSGVGLLGLLTAQLGVESITLSEYGSDKGVLIDNDFEIESINEIITNDRLMPTALISNLRYNVRLNGLTDKVNVRHIDWYDYLTQKNHMRSELDSSYDLIIGSDLINWEDDVEALVSTLQYFTELNKCPVLISLQDDNRKGVPVCISQIEKAFPGQVRTTKYSLQHYDLTNLLMIFIGF